MKRIFTILSIFLCATVLCQAQQANQNAVAKFDESKHDFGVRPEEGGPIAHDFKVTNTGMQPLVITKVQASCGCTTPSWPKEPIMPGKSGVITASYNPQKRPGKFTKTITVTSNAEPSTTILTINGEITPKPKGVEDFYPTKKGNLRMESTQLAFGNIKNNGPAIKEMKIYNDGKTKMTLSVTSKIPDWLKITVEPKFLEPGKEGKISGIIDGTKKKDWGFESVSFDLTTSDTEEPVKQIYASSILEEYFPPMSETEKANAPAISFDKVKHDFGNVKQGETVKTDFLITNNGKKDLVIRKTKASCGCTLSKPEKSTLKAGQSTKMAVSFNSTGKKGVSNNNVTVISNDPAKSTLIVNISANVLEPGEASN